jgi:tryptophan-rich sensory protein
MFAMQLALNFAWSPLFFKKHDLKLASADITGGLQQHLQRKRGVFLYSAVGVLFQTC